MSRGSTHSLPMREFRFLLAFMIAVTGCGTRLGAVPTPATASPPVRSPVPSFRPPSDPSYPSGALQNEQDMVPVVGMDRLVPLWPAFEYFARAGIANGGNVVSYATTQISANTAVVQICRADGTVIRADVYLPFPSASTPIWAVRSYRLGR
jgi:hypothetical protein